MWETVIALVIIGAVAFFIWKKRDQASAIKDKIGGFFGGGKSGGGDNAQQ